MESTEIIETSEIYEEDIPLNPEPRSDIRDYVWSSIMVIIILAIFLVQEPAKLFHWMLLPLLLCGIIVGADAVRWLKGSYALFDPKGTIGLLGINFFLIAPILVVFYEIEKVETYEVYNWQPLVGSMAIINVVGLLIYKIAERISFKRPSKVEWTYWSLNFQKATLYVTLFFIVTFISFCVFIVRGGGLGGILLQTQQNEMIASLGGFGAVMILRDGLPLVTLIGLTVLRIMKAPQEKSNAWFIVSFCVLILFFVSSGLRGSRAATGYGLICAGAIIHFFWRRLTVKIVLLSLIPLGLFFYLYGFYKSAGIVGIRELIAGRATIESLQEQTSRTVVGYLVGDLSRAHIQAVELDVLINKPWQYRYRYGKTYPLSIGYIIPRQIWRSKPIDMGRIIAGTEMLYGPGSYGSHVKVGGSGNRSTALYGLAGEAMLNFGIWGIPFAFAVWGYIVGRIRKRLYSYRPGDIRLFMTGFWMLFSFMMLFADADQLVWFTLSLFIIPATLIFLISEKVALND